MPRELGVDANRDPVVRIGADVAVLRVGLAFGKIGSNAIVEGVERRGVDRLVRISPVDMLVARWLLDEELVLGRTARMRARVDDQLPVAAQNALTAPDGVFDELRGAQIVPELCGFEFFGNGKNGSTLSNR